MLKHNFATHFCWYDFQVAELQIECWLLLYILSNTYELLELNFMRWINASSIKWVLFPCPVSDDISCDSFRCFHSNQWTKQREDEMLIRCSRLLFKHLSVYISPKMENWLGVRIFLLMKRKKKHTFESSFPYSRPVNN